MMPDKRPNILFVLSDQHSHKFYGRNDLSIVDTPNLDKLAGKGVTLTNAYCQNPLCVPSRSSILTGQYSKSLGVYENRHILDPAHLTLPTVLQEAGYRTCLIGKAHFNGEQYHGYAQRPYGDLYGQGHQPEEIRGYDDEDESGLGDILGNSGATQIPLTLTQTEICVSEAVKWLQCHADTSSERPFFLSVNFDKPHFPFRAPKSLFEKYEGKVSLPDYPAAYLEEKAVPFVQKAVMINGKSRNYAEDTDVHLRALAAYCACVEWVDDALGRILAALDYLGLSENTIVIYTSDHGEMAGAKGAWQKTLFFDESSKVPLLISWPGKYPKDCIKDGIVGLIDIFPTLCSAAGIKIPESCAGVDLNPYLTGKRALERDAIFCESTALKHPEISGCMIRTRQYKYSYYLDGMSELYDFVNDPGEWNNLSGQKIYSDLEKQLHERVINFWQPEEQINRYLACPAVKNEKHFYLFSNQFVINDGTVVNARP